MTLQNIMEFRPWAAYYEQLDMVGVQTSADSFQRLPVNKYLNLLVSEVSQNPVGFSIQTVSYFLAIPACTGEGLIDLDAILDKIAEDFPENTQKIEEAREFLEIVGPFVIIPV